MSIDTIREQLSIEISKNSGWLDILNDTNPGHYGVEDWEIIAHPEDIWVDIPNRTFNFRNASFDFEVLLGASNPKDGEKMTFSKVAAGQGIFDFIPKTNKIKIEELEINCDLDLFR